jgi:molybdenum cofactor cytidylyltransferase
MKNLGVIILAAGASSRMGRPKLLLPWNGTTIIGHLISQWHSLEVMQIAVVLRPDDVGMATELDRLGFSKTGRIYNPEPERGMFSSILCAAGWEGWRPEISNWAIVLGDQPHLRMETLRKLVDFCTLNADAVCQPAYEGRAAHPVILPRAIFRELKDSQTVSLKEFLNLGAFRSVQYVINDPGLALDLDTPEDYKQAQGSKLVV